MFLSHMNGLNPMIQSGCKYFVPPGLFPSTLVIKGRDSEDGYQQKEIGFNKKPRPSRFSVYGNLHSRAPCEHARYHQSDVGEAGG